MERQQGGDRETWWWNEEVQLAVREIKIAFKRWQSEGTEDTHEQYRKKNRKAKRTVAIAKDRAWKNWSEHFGRTKEKQRCSR